MRCSPSRWRCVGFAGLVAALLLVRPSASLAACTSASCDQLPCGSRECIGATCQTFYDDAGTVCRPAAGVCDVAETCTGSSLSCPSDKKKPAATVCRPSAGVCDGVEECDGVSNGCPADVGLEPTLSRVSIVRGTEILGRGDTYYSFVVEVTGANLCTGEINVPNHLNSSDTLLADDGPPSSRLSFTFYDPDRNSLDEEFPTRGTYGFDINAGAVAGTLDFAVDDFPDGYVQILSLVNGAHVGPEPTFSLRNLCTNCEFFSVRLSSGYEPPPITPIVPPTVQEATSEPMAPPPVGMVIELGLADFTGTPLAMGLPSDDYTLYAEVLDGTSVPDQTFAGDPSGLQFEYRSGWSKRSWINFSAPEASAGRDALAALAGLALCACVRGRRRRRR